MEKHKLYISGMEGRTSLQVLETSKDKGRAFWEDDGYGDSIVF